MQVHVNERHFGCSRRDAEAFLMFLCWTMVDACVVVCPVGSLREAQEVSTHVRTCNLVFNRQGEEVHRGGSCQSHERLREAAQLWLQSDLKDDRL